ncbi:type II toxin-antitoxin system PemK/MazF family toxin [Lichenihabitans sp. Uapishka_5]|uniref:type II toxin-antitoxin system PemK/MazF family toxin n=1 Tax=Lichenihabitans sp. Uapishka_5 TaxID=3037302 RepID=UPI0029E80D5E|nr:type II toxin-antitoxin system PemK/MazF family toxin [Lichenihabitans sp. Uapishka_5]MDX7951985.1 type II toxin-antitoxin system PemK/MazF family toxin [Lichenihabitans sp. Uapishka_5]
MTRGEIWMVDLDPTQGREQRGHRLVVVVSPDAFNRATGLPVVLPITNGGDFARRLGFAVPLVGTKTTGIVRCDQPRVIDLAACRARMIETMPQAILDDVMARVVTIFV